MFIWVGIIGLLLVVALLDTLSQQHAALWVKCCEARWSVAFTVSSSVGIFGKFFLKACEMCFFFASLPGPLAGPLGGCFRTKPGPWANRLNRPAPQWDMNAKLCVYLWNKKKKMIIQKYRLGESLWISAAWISRDSQGPTRLYVSHTDNSCGCCSEHGSVRGREPSSSPAWAAGDSRFVFDPPLYKLHVSYGCLGILLPHITLCSGWSFVCLSSKSQVSHSTITSSSRGAWPTS